MSVDLSLSVHNPQVGILGGMEDRRQKRQASFCIHGKGSGQLSGPFECILKFKDF